MDKSFQKNLDNALEYAKNELKNTNINLTFFNEFIIPTSVHDVDKNVLYIKTKNIFAKQSLNNDYKDFFQKKINEKNNTNYMIEFITENEYKILTPLVAKSNLKETIDFLHEEKTFGVNENYTFSNFVVSEFNKTAYNAAQSLFKQKFWNPIFISGGVGLGKTHLLHAIANEFKNKYPNKRIKYIATDDFIREVYNSFSLSGNAVEELKEKYETYDLLLMDDIQFLEKKEKINEIFFNIFNKNITNNKIIVMTSDKEPGLLSNLEDRMKSRFHSGLYTKITNPDINSVKKILEEKIKQAGESFIFVSDAINYIARRNSQDIRKLEGFLHQILFYAINNLPPSAIINLDVVKANTEIDKNDNISKYGFDVNPEIIIDQICGAYSIKPEIVKSKNRTKQVSLIRQICMYVLRKKFNMNFSQIGSFFSGRDHSTVMEAISNIDKKIKRDEKLEEFITNLYKKI